MFYFTNFGDLCDSVVSIYMGFLEAPPILIRNLYFPTKVIYFRNKTILILLFFLFFLYSDMFTLQL